MIFEEMTTQEIFLELRKRGVACVVALMVDDMDVKRAEQGDAEIIFYADGCEEDVMDIMGVGMATVTGEMDGQDEDYEEE